MNFYDIQSKYEHEEPEAEIIKALDEMDITSVDNSGNTLLHIAARFGDSEGIKHLLEKGCSANANNNYGENALFALGSLDDRYIDYDSNKIKECAVLLLDNKASVLKRSDNNGETVVTNACKNGRWEIIEACIEKGSKLNFTNKHGETPLHCLAEGSKSALDSLKYAGNDSKSLEQKRLEEFLGPEFAKEHAAPADNSKKEKAQKKVDDYLKCAHLLVDAGLDPTEKNSYDKTAIEYAITAGNKDMAAYFNGDDSNAAAGGMDYWQAIDAQDIEAIKAIGGDINAVCDDGKYKGLTPLQVACKSLYSDGVKALLDAGADPNAKNSDGVSAMGSLVSYDAGMKNNGYIFQNKEVEKILNAMKESGCNFDETINDEGDSSLIGACRAGGPGSRPVKSNFYGLIAQWLIDHGADLNRANHDGQTALLVLGEKTNDALNVYTSLLEQGVDVAAIDKKGNTALHYLAINTDKSLAKEMADMLFSFDFTLIDAVNNDGKTALEVATDTNNEQLVKIILEHM